MQGQDRARQGRQGQADRQAGGRASGQASKQASWLACELQSGVLPFRPVPCCRLLGGLEEWDLSVDSMREEQQEEAAEADTAVAAAAAAEADCEEASSDGFADAELPASSPADQPDADSLISFQQLLAQLRTLPASVQNATRNQV